MSTHGKSDRTLESGRNAHDHRKPPKRSWETAPRGSRWDVTIFKKKEVFSLVDIIVKMGDRIYDLNKNAIDKHEWLHMQRILLVAYTRATGGRWPQLLKFILPYINRILFDEYVMIGYLSVPNIDRFNTYFRQYKSRLNRTFTTGIIKHMKEYYFQDKIPTKQFVVKKYWSF